MEFNERYIFDTFTDLLAEGSHARVYKAFDKLLEREICLKVFTKEFAAGSPVIQQLNRAGIFFHPNICAFYDLIEVSSINVFGEKEMQPVGIFEYNNCGTITSFLKSNTEPEVTKKLLKDVLKGLSYLHSLENPHLDLKPNNILIKKTVATPTAKITDFLNSTNIKAKNAYSENTNSGLAYKAPEHFSGNQASLDYRADIWSLGTIVFEIVTGTSLFHDADDTTEKTIKNILLSDFDSKIANLPEPFKAFVAKCLVRDVAKRNVSLEELSIILEETEKSTLSSSPITQIPILENKIEENSLDKTTIFLGAKVFSENEEEDLVTSFNTIPKTVAPETVSTSEKSKPASLLKMVMLLSLYTVFFLCIGIVAYTYFDAKKELPSITTVAKENTKTPISRMISDTISEKKEDTIPLAKVEPNKTLTPVLEPTKTSINEVIYSSTNTIKTIADNVELEAPNLPDYGVLYKGKSYNFNLGYGAGIEYSLWADQAIVKEIGVNNFTVTPTSEAPINMLLLDKKDRTKITEKTYTVKAKPLLVATLGDDINGGYVSAQVIISKLNMQVKADGRPMKVKSFRLSCASGTCSVTESEGGFFNSSIVQFLRKTRAGEKIRFDNIRALDQEGEEYQVKDFSVTLTDSFMH